MARTETETTHLITELTPFLSAPRPLEAAARAGVRLPPDLTHRGNGRDGGKPFPPELAASLDREYGPPPRTNVNVGRRPIAALGPSGYALVASTDLSVANEILAELWRVGTIPHQMTENVTSSFLSLSDLQAHCNGVPDGATVGLLELPRPPVASASSVSNANLHFDVPFRMPVLVDNQEAAALEGMLRLEIPLDFHIDTQSFVQLSLEAITGVTGTLTIDAASTITPKSETERGALENLLIPRSRTALLLLTTSYLRFSASMDIQKSKFPNSKLRVVQAGAITFREGNRDFAVVGINVENQHTVNNLALANVPLPGPDLNVHAIVAEEFARDALSAIITSGDLAAFINRVIARHTPGNVADVRVDGGRVHFQNGKLAVGIDCTMVDACAIGKDLSFTANLTGTPTVANGELTIDSSDVTYDLDNVDAFLCTILNSIYGPVGTVVTLAVLAFIAFYSSEGKDADIPVSETSTPLPGSDKVVKVELTQATMTPGVLTAEGRLSLISDPEHVFAYLRVVESLGRILTFPLPGVKVDLYELDNPPPEGDDVAVPETGETDTFGHRTLTETIIDYTPSGDQLLGSETTDGNGNVTFVVSSNKIGGIETKTVTTSDTYDDHVISYHSQQIPIPEPGPDLAVTITAPNGQVLAQRRLVGLNVSTRRLGTFDHRVAVVVSPPKPSVHPGVFE